MCDNRMDMTDIYLKRIRKIIPEAARYEQLAEECTELAQACLKKARKLRDENYTPKNMDEIDKNLEEEFSDVTLSAYACGLVVNWKTYFEKAERWVNRNENRG